MVLESAAEGIPMLKVMLAAHLCSVFHLSFCLPALGLGHRASNESLGRAKGSEISLINGPFSSSCVYCVRLHLGSSSSLSVWALSS